MRIQFKKITADNFRSLEHAEVDLSGQGIVIVKGVNEYEDNASSNGSGKSSIFEAIVYAIFDETSSGEKDVANRINNTGFCVKLDFCVDGIDYTIQRQLKSNKTSVVLYKQNIDISCRNKTDTNKLILNILNVTKSIFLDSIFLAQSASTNLATLSPTARKERLETLTNTDLTINKFKDEIKAKQLQYEALNVDVKMDINKILGNNETLNQQISDLQKQIADAESKRAERDALGDVDAINANITKLEQAISKNQKEISDLSDVLTTISDKITNQNNANKDNLNQKDLLDNRLQELRSEYNEYTQLYNTYLQKISFEKSTISRIEGEIADIKNSDVCPVCKRKLDNVNEEHIHKAISDKEHLIAQSKESINSWNIEITKLTSQLDEISSTGNKLKDTELKEIQAVLQEHSNVIDALEGERKQVINNQRKIESDIEEAQQKIRRLNMNKEQLLSIVISDIKPLEEQLDRVSTQYQNNQQRIIELSKKQDEIAQYIEVSKNILYLITTGFRTYLLQNSIRFLNHLLLQYSEKLFSNASDIIHIEESDTKLNIFLGEASYESLSGGEKTRVNIALLLAQKALASNIGNTWSNIIILDEVLGFCDSSAEERVINLIIQELESLESIYMVSHKELPIGYDNQIIVVKDINGLSHIK